MPDEIIQELWRIKDGMAREHGNGVRKLAAYLQGSHPEAATASEGKSAVDVLNKAPSQRLSKATEDTDTRAQDKRTS